MADLKTQTIRDFGRQWSAFQDNPGYYGSADLLADLFGPLLSLDEVKGRRAADIGSGTGRIVNMLLDAGAAHVHAVEPSTAITVLKENTAERRDRVTYGSGSGETLPPDLGLDLVVAIGVLHHIPDPEPVVRAAYHALRPGGRMLVWLYGHEGNETYLRLVEPLRAVTTRLPHLALVGLSQIIALFLDGYIVACAVLPLPMRSYMREVLAKFPRRVRRLTIYDQLSPAYAKYYTRHEAEALLRGPGFTDVQLYHRHGYSWTVTGRRPETEQRERARGADLRAHEGGARPGEGARRSARQSAAGGEQSSGSARARGGVAAAARRVSRLSSMIAASRRRAAGRSPPSAYFARCGGSVSTRADLAVS